MRYAPLIGVELGNHYWGRHSNFLYDTFWFIFTDEVA